MKRILLSLSLCVALLSACQGPSNCGRLIGSEQVIAVSPNPDSIYLYTPGIVEGFGGRFVVAVDYGGPGTYALDGTWRLLTSHDRRYHCPVEGLR